MCGWLVVVIHNLYIMYIYLQTTESGGYWAIIPSNHCHTGGVAKAVAQVKHTAKDTGRTCTTQTTPRDTRSIYSTIKNIGGMNPAKGY